MPNAGCVPVASQRQPRDCVCDLVSKTQAINDMLDSLEARLFGNSAPKETQAKIDNAPQHLQHGLVIIENNADRAGNKLNEFLSKI